MLAVGDGDVIHPDNMTKPFHASFRDFIHRLYLAMYRVIIMYIFVYLFVYIYTCILLPTVTQTVNLI